MRYDRDIDLHIDFDNNSGSYYFEVRKSGQLLQLRLDFRKEEQALQAGESWVSSYTMLLEEPESNFSR